MDHELDFKGSLIRLGGVRRHLLPGPRQRPTAHNRSARWAGTVAATIPVRSHVMESQ
jgi:hypothetical protein